MGSLALLATLLFLFSPSSAHADFYRWVDRDGKEFFTNDAKQIPREYQGQAVVVKPDDSRVSVADKPLFQGKASAPARDHRDRHGRGEEHWSRKASNLRLKLRDQQDEYDLVLKQMNDDPAPRSSGKRKKSGSSLGKKKVKLEKEMAQTRRMLEVDLPEEARRAGAYPGWLRE